MIYESLNNWTVAMVLDKIRKVFYSCTTDEQKQVADKYSTGLIIAYSKQHKIKQHSEQYCLIYTRASSNSLSDNAHM